MVNTQQMLSVLSTLGEATVTRTFRARTGMTEVRYIYRVLGLIDEVKLLGAVASAGLDVTKYRLSRCNVNGWFLHNDAEVDYDVTVKKESFRWVGERRV